MGFFSPIPLSHATKKLDIFFNMVCCTESLQQRFVLFVALSHCDKHIFFIVALSHCDKQDLYMFQKKDAKKGQKCLFCAVALFFWKILCIFLFFSPLIFGTFWHFMCNIYQFCLLQWLSATNKTNLCHSESVQQTILKSISNFFAACDKGI